MIDEIMDKIKDAHQIGIESLKDQSTRIENIANIIANSIKSGGKILIAGNGGSAADSQHFAGEIVGRYVKERVGYPAIALTTDTSILTAVGNDYGFDEIFKRQVQALGKEGDVFFAISTSGNSSNIISAITEAKKHKLIVIGLTGRDGGKMVNVCDYHINIPLKDTPRVQEFHITVIHIIAEMIESIMTKC